MSSSYQSVAAPLTMGDVTADYAMDSVQRRLMFEDECILVHENDRVVGHDTKYNCHLMENSVCSCLTPPSRYCFSHPLYRDSELIEENAIGVRNAAQRKLLDELGISADKTSQLISLFHGSYAV